MSYPPGGYGTSVATLLEGKTPVGKKAPPIKPVKFIEGTGLAVNTLPPSDHTYFDLINDIVQSEPGGTLNSIS